MDRRNIHMVWNTVESIRFNYFVVKYGIFVSVVERNHHTALMVVPVMPSSTKNKVSV